MSGLELVEVTATKAKKVLIFDDRPDSLEDTIEVLKKEGLNIAKARNIVEFADQLKIYGAEDAELFGPTLEPGMGTYTMSESVIWLDIFLEGISDLNVLQKRGMSTRPEEAGYQIWKRVLHTPESMYGSVPVVLTSEYAFIDEHYDEISRARSERGLPVSIHPKRHQDRETIKNLLREIEVWREEYLSNVYVRRRILRSWMNMAGVNYAEVAQLLGLRSKRASLIRLYCENGFDPQNEDFDNRIDILFDIMVALDALFDSNSRHVKRWLTEEDEALGKMSPLRLLLTGTRENWAKVWNAIEALGFGVD